MENNTPKELSGTCPFQINNRISLCVHAIAKHAHVIYFTYLTNHVKSVGC
jgi:hypothetical protein